MNIITVTPVKKVIIIIVVSEKFSVKMKKEVKKSIQHTRSVFLTINDIISITFLILGEISVFTLLSICFLPFLFGSI